eukprot:c25549_g1_i1.p1 GENE.c25549_g1_i1~~c25549_g1_i1.p1  ORF type:complete len:594 (-),score=120.73 c25549_g1_i1:61-1680(-)
MMGYSLLLKKVEKTVGHHFCEFWNECKKSCQWKSGNGFTWEDEMVAWRPLSTPKTSSQNSLAKRPKLLEFPDRLAPAYNKSFFCTVDCTCFEGVFCSHREATKGESTKQAEHAVALIPKPIVILEIPVIDLSAFVNPNSTLESRKATAKLIGHACENVGFLYVVNHGISRATLDGMLTYCRMFFAQDEAVKTEAAMRIAGGIRGYFAKGEENLHKDGNTILTDIKEGFDMGHDDYSCDLKAMPKHAMVNQFPSSCDRTVPLQYLDQITTVARCMIHAFALSLDLEETYFDAMFERPMATLRLLHYPPTMDVSSDSDVEPDQQPDQPNSPADDQLVATNSPDEKSRPKKRKLVVPEDEQLNEELPKQLLVEDEEADGAQDGREFRLLPSIRPTPCEDLLPPKRLGCGEHTDYGICTLLYQDGVGGLQVQSSERKWLDAIPLPGSFVVNIGDMMQRWTNHRFRSTIHRVKSNPSKDRYSIPFFVNPGVDTLVECIETCKGDGAIYKPETCESILLSRYAPTMPHLFKKPTTEDATTANKYF